MFQKIWNQRFGRRCRPLLLLQIFATFIYNERIHSVHYIVSRKCWASQITKSLTKSWFATLIHQWMNRSGVLPDFCLLSEIVLFRKIRGSSSVPDFFLQKPSIQSIRLYLQCCMILQLPLVWFYVWLSGLGNIQLFKENYCSFKLLDMWESYPCEGGRLIKSLKHEVGNASVIAKV